MMVLGVFKGEHGVEVLASTHERKDGGGWAHRLVCLKLEGDILEDFSGETTEEGHEGVTKREARLNI
jgi:hypothetical protein